MAKRATNAQDKHARFVSEYLKDQNATLAAVRAGYSPKTARAQGSRLLTHVDIRAAVDAGLAKAAQNAGESIERLLGDFRTVADRCLQATEVLDSKGNPTGEWRFDATNAVSALEKIGKHLRMFTDVVEVNDRRVLLDWRQRPSKT